MKEFFGIDLTYDKRNIIEDGADYAAKTISKQLEKQLADASEEAISATVDQSYPMSKVPFILRVASWLCGIGMITMLTLGMKSAATAYGDSETAITVSQLLSAAKWHILGAVVLFIAWIITLVCIAKKRKEIKSPDRIERTDRKIEELNKLAEEELSVPADALNIDVLSYMYTSNNGENKIKNSIFYKYLNTRHRIFTDDDKLCIVGNASRYEIPLDSIKKLRTVSDTGLLSIWTKPEPPTAAPYAGVVAKKADGLGRIKLYSCCVMEFVLDQEEFSMRFPAYEAPVLEQLTGLKTIAAEE